MGPSGLARVLLLRASQDYGMLETARSFVLNQTKFTTSLHGSGDATRSTPLSSHPCWVEDQHLKQALEHVNLADLDERFGFDAEQDWAFCLWENNSGSPSLACC